MQQDSDCENYFFFFKERIIDDEFDELMRGFSVSIYTIRMWNKGIYEK